MSRLSDEEIEKAKEVDLISYLQSYEPQELIRVGPHDYKTRTHGSLCISDIDTQKTFNQQTGGNK